MNAFDGQYIHPNASNDAVEWWWGQAIAEPVGTNPPAAFQFLFYQGPKTRATLTFLVAELAFLTQAIRSRLAPVIRQCQSST